MHQDGRGWLGATTTGCYYNCHLTVALSPDASSWTRVGGCAVRSWGEVVWPAASSFLGGTPPALGPSTAHGTTYYALLFFFVWYWYGGIYAGIITTTVTS